MKLLPCVFPLLLCVCSAYSQVATATFYGMSDRSSGAAIVGLQ